MNEIHKDFTYVADPRRGSPTRWVINTREDGSRVALVTQALPLTLEHLQSVFPVLPKLVLDPQRDVKKRLAHDTFPTISELVEWVIEHRPDMTSGVKSLEFWTSKLDTCAEDLRDLAEEPVDQIRAAAAKWGQSSSNWSDPHQFYRTWAQLIDLACFQGRDATAVAHYNGSRHNQWGSILLVPTAEWAEHRGLSLSDFKRVHDDLNDFSQWMARWAFGDTWRVDEIRNTLTGEIITQKSGPWMVGASPEEAGIPDYCEVEEAFPTAQSE